MCNEVWRTDWHTTGANVSVGVDLPPAEYPLVRLGDIDLKGLLRGFTINILWWPDNVQLEPSKRHWLIALTNPSFPLPTSPPPIQNDTMDKDLVMRREMY